MNRIQKIFSRKAIGYGLFLIAFTLLACELILRIYNPFPFRLKGDDVILPRNQRFIIHNGNVRGLDSAVVVLRNSLGLRGPEPPMHFDSSFTVITIGGSATECFNMNETDTWPWLLGKKLESDFQPVWLNNAGVAGQSSWAHYLLVSKYIKYLRPKVVFIMAGWNDIRRADLQRNDIVETNKNAGLKGFLSRNSEVYNLAVNLKRHYYYQSREIGVIKDYPFFITRNHPLLFTSREHDDSILRAETGLVVAYKRRMSGIIDTCRAHGILPILITQPGMPGNGIEPETGCDLDDYLVFPGVPGKLHKALLQMYNTSTMETAREKGVFCVDLARLLPAKLENYTDICHYTKNGCGRVAQIVYEQSIGYLKSNFPSYLKRSL